MIFFQKKKGFTLPIKDWIPKKIEFLEEFLPKKRSFENFI